MKFRIAVSMVVGAAMIMQTRGAIAQNTGRSALPGSLALERIPADALEVSEAMKTAKIGETIAIRGRLAMAKDVFVSGRAMFTLTDDSAAAACCAPGAKLMDTCNIPAESKVTVQAVDDKGAILRTGLEGKGGLTHGAEVFVVGRVMTTNNLTALVINATGIHVPREGLPAGFLVRDMPEHTADLSAARAAGSLKEGDKVAVRGVVGGSNDPFVAGRAMFTLVGSALKPCNAKDDDHCPKPWDYCCETKADITANSATIRAVDRRNQPLRTDFKNRWRIRELSDIVVVGTVAATEHGGLIVNATGVHVIKP